MATKDHLLAYPIINDIEYRSNISSKDLNLMLKSIEESILRTIIRSAEVETNLNKLTLATNSSYLALSRSNQIYNSYPKPYDIPSGEYGGVAFATAFGEVVGVRKDDSIGIATMDWKDNKKLSKIPIYEGIVSPAIQIYVDSELRSIDDPVYNILDKDKSTLWVEETSAGEHNIEIVLPPATQRTFNYLELVPFPVFGMEITSGTYNNSLNIEQIIYPTKDNLFYNNSGPLKMHLSPREYNNSIKIYFNVIDGVNSMGFTSVDICSIDYMNNTNTVYLKFENVPQIDHTGTAIENIRPASIDLDFYVDGVDDENYNSFISEISLVTSPTANPTSQLAIPKKRGLQIINSSNSAFSVDQGTGQSNSLYLKFVMNEVNLTTPVLRGAKLNYREIS